MKTTILAILLCTLSTAAFGQSVVYRNVKKLNIQAHATDFNRYKKVNANGTPFYNQDWRTGFVILNKTTKSQNLKLKYNSYNNKLLFLKNGKALTAQPSDFIGFVFTDKNSKTVFKSGFQSNKYDIQPQQLLRVIYNGNVKLLAKEYTNLYKHKNVFKGKMVYTFDSGRKYFLVTPNGTFHKIKLKASDIFKVLGHKKELKKYVNKHNLDWGKEKDLAMILLYYDSILSKH